MSQQLQPIEYCNQRIVTTQQLAEFYGVDAQIINNNFNRNKKRYIEGKHYFFLEGDDLQNWFCSNQIDVSKEEINKIRRLYLWTKRGTFRHAKSLNTDRAWEVYETLEENYFNPQQSALQEVETLKNLKAELNSLLNLSTETKLALDEVDSKIKHSKFLIATYERKEYQKLAIPTPRPEQAIPTDEEKVLRVIESKFKRRWANSYTISQAGSTHLRKVGSIAVRKILDELVAEGKVEKDGYGKRALYRKASL